MRVFTLIALAMIFIPTVQAEVKLKCPPGSKHEVEPFQETGESHFCARKSTEGKLTLNGPCVQFVASGIKGYEGEFTEGQKNGTFRYYHENGKLKESSKFEMGKPMGKASYYWPNGKKQAEGDFKNGERTGTWVFFDEATGKKISEGPYSTALEKFKQQQAAREQQASALKQKGLMEGAPCGEYLEYQSQNAYTQQIAAEAQANGSTVEGDFPELERKTKATYGKFLLARDRFEKRSKMKFNSEWCQ